MELHMHIGCGGKRRGKRWRKGFIHNKLQVPIGGSHFFVGEEASSFGLGGGIKGE
jgi:hypothetical protein